MRKLLLPLFVLLMLNGCVHDISVAPELSKVTKVRPVTIERTVAYYIPPERYVQRVTTPGGNNDELRYTPYQDTEPALKKVLNNVKDLVLPYVDKLKNTRLKAKDRTLVEIIDTHLQDIISPLLQRFSNAKILLTPQEMQVAALVKDGKTSKEIADILNVSETTVNFHRKNLRVKFGLTNQRTNLRSYLMNLSQ